MPVTFGKGGQLGGDFGRIDLYAIRLLGLWVAALIVVLLNTERLSKYLTQFQVSCIISFIFNSHPIVGAFYGLWNANGCEAHGAIFISSSLYLPQCQRANKL